MTISTPSQFLNHPLYPYDKAKVNILKATLPFFIILHHISTFGFPDLEALAASGHTLTYLFYGMMCGVAMNCFFAMSGYGLTISFINNRDYICGFLKRSLSKLFIPYIIALIFFVVYRQMHGVDQMALLKAEGVWGLVPTSWFIYVLALFYVFFFVAFRFVGVGVAAKAIVTCLLVVGYAAVAPLLGVYPHQYVRCPGFCVGVLFAVLNGGIMCNLRRWHAIVLLCLLMATLPFRLHALDCFVYPCMLFILMYCLPSPREVRAVRFLSSISLEMFIVQYLPIYIVVRDLGVWSTLAVIPLVLLLDFVLAWGMHFLVLRVRRAVERRSEGV